MGWGGVGWGWRLVAEAGAKAAGGVDGVLEGDIAGGERGERGDPLLLDQPEDADATAAVAHDGALGAAAEEAARVAVARVGHEPGEIGPAGAERSEEWAREIRAHIVVPLSMEWLSV